MKVASKETSETERLLIVGEQGLVYLEDVEPASGDEELDDQIGHTASRERVPGPADQINLAMAALASRIWASLTVVTQP